MSVILAGTAILGAIQSGVALANLVKLGKKSQANYGITPEQQRSYDQAQVNATRGFNPAQRGAFMNNITSSQNAAYQKAVDVGGGQSSQAIGGILKANRLGAFNQFAAQDASLQLQNQRYADQMGQNITQQRNLATGQDIQNRVRQETAWGGALQSGLTNIASAGNFAAMTAQGYNPVTGVYDRQTSNPVNTVNTTTAGTTPSTPANTTPIGPEQSYVETGKFNPYYIPPTNLNLSTKLKLPKPKFG